MARKTKRRIMKAARDNENPVWTAREVAKATPGAKFLPALMGEAGAKHFLTEVRRSRGPGRKPRKIPLSIRLDRDVVEHFKSGGRGWQVRINATLRKALKAA